MGKKYITEISDRDREVLKFFSKYQPCFFKGCEELRAKYNTEIEKLAEQNCPACQKGAVMRRYMKIINDVLDQQELEYAEST
jgi:hypothetical protein